MLRGTLLRHLDKYDQAIACFQQVLKSTKDFAAAQGLISCYMAVGRLKEALIIARDFQAAAPRNPRAITLVGSVLIFFSLFVDSAHIFTRRYGFLSVILSVWFAGWCAGDLQMATPRPARHSRRRCPSMPTAWTPFWP